LASIAEWQHFIDREGFAMTLLTEATFDGLGGFLPVRYGDVEAGFECYHEDAAAIMDMCEDVDFGHRWKYALGLRFGGNLDALFGANACGAAYAKATGGVFFDTEANEILTAEKALQSARDIEKDLPRLRAFLASPI
jgi:hypothetical protein